MNQPPGDDLDRSGQDGGSIDQGARHLNDLPETLRIALTDALGSGPTEQAEALGRLQAVLQESPSANAIENDPTLTPIDQISLLLSQNMGAWEERIDAASRAVSDAEAAGRPTEEFVRKLEELTMAHRDFAQRAAEALQPSAAPLNQRIGEGRSATGAGGSRSLIAVGAGVAAVAAITVGAFALLGGADDSTEGDGSGDNGSDAAVVQTAAPGASETAPAAATAVDASDAVFPVPALAADLFGAIDIEAAVQVRVGEAGGVTFLVDRSAIMEPPPGGSIRVFIDGDTEGAFVESALSSGTAFTPAITLFERPTIVELARVPLDPAQAMSSDERFELFFPVVQSGEGPVAIVAGTSYPLTGMRLNAATRDADNNELFLGAVVIDVGALAELQAEYAETAARTPQDRATDRDRTAEG